MYHFISNWPIKKKYATLSNHSTYLQNTDEEGRQEVVIIFNWNHLTLNLHRHHFWLIRNHLPHYLTEWGYIWSNTEMRITFCVNISIWFHFMVSCWNDGILMWKQNQFYCKMKNLTLSSFASAIHLQVEPKIQKCWFYSEKLCFIFSKNFPRY